MLDHVRVSERVDKPWGAFERYAHNTARTVKITAVAPGGVLSRQYHQKRDELWTVLDPRACVERGRKTLYPVPMEKLFIPRGTVHRLSGDGAGPVRVIGVSFGEFDEDIVCLDDVYGRG